MDGWSPCPAKASRSPTPQRPPGGCGEPVKILHHNAYEHFEFTHEYCDLHGVTLPVYRWSYRTYIAE